MREVGPDGTLALFEDPRILEDLKKKVLSTFSPSEPVRTPELLHGREGVLKRTLETLEIPGRSVFVFGERGVGKTSLAQTSAHLFNTSNVEPVLVSCHPTVGFSRLLAQITRKLLAVPLVQEGRKRTTEIRVGTAMAGLIHRIESEPDFVPASIDVNEAVDLLNEVTRGLPEHVHMVVVVDELDTTVFPSPRLTVLGSINEARIG